MPVEELIEAGHDALETRVSFAALDPLSFIHVDMVFLPNSTFQYDLRIVTKTKVRLLCRGYRTPSKSVGEPPASRTSIFDNQTLCRPADASPTSIWACGSSASACSPRYSKNLGSSKK